VKRIIVIAAVLGLVVAMAVGAASSGAWFKKTDSSLNGSVATGSFELGVGSPTGGFSATNLEPGAAYVSAGTFWVSNDGDYNMKWRGWVQNIDDPSNLRSYLLVKCVMNPVALDGPYGPGVPTVLWSGVPLLELTEANWPTYKHILMDDPTWPFTPGAWAGYELLVRLDSTADNDQLDATLTLDVYLEATQRINTGWTQ